jgi:cation:H+ antiporter
MADLLVQLLIFAVSLAVLPLASHFAIISVEKLIESTGLSEASAGFIILSVMTSTPEITVALFSVLQGTPGISIGDILGSNVFNIGAVVGILGMLGYLATCCTDRLIKLTDILFLTSLTRCCSSFSRFQALLWVSFFWEHLLLTSIIWRGRKCRRLM